MWKMLWNIIVFVIFRESPSRGATAERLQKYREEAADSKRRRVLNKNNIQQTSHLMLETSSGFCQTLTTNSDKSNCTDASETADVTQPLMEGQQQAIPSSQEDMSLQPRAPAEEESSTTTKDGCSQTSTWNTSQLFIFNRVTTTEVIYNSVLLQTPYWVWPYQAFTTTVGKRGVDTINRFITVTLP